MIHQHTTHNGKSNKLFKTYIMEQQLINKNYMVFLKNCFPLLNISFMKDVYKAQNIPEKMNSE